MPRRDMDAGRPATPASPSSGERRDRLIRASSEVTLTRVGIVATAIALVLFETGMFFAVADALGSGSGRRTAEGIVFAAVVTFLVYGNLVYQTARLGYLTRRRSHRAATRAELDGLYDGPPRPLVALIPSYREEPG